jgi:hypothetical protein
MNGVPDDVEVVTATSWDTPDEVLTEYAYTDTGLGGKAAGYARLPTMPYCKWRSAVASWNETYRGHTQDAFFPQAASSQLATIVSGSGVYLVDSDGRRLLDVASGPFLANLGQGNERVLRAMLDQGRRLTYTYSRTTRNAANAALTERLAGLAGPGFERVHLTSGGSEAVEMALKFLRQYAVATGQPQRHRIISMLPGYHGATTQTLGLNGDLAGPALSCVPQLGADSGHTDKRMPRSADRGWMRNAEITGHTINFAALVLQGTPG